MNDEVFWQAVAASVALATAVSTAVAWIVGSWARNRSRTEADWAFTVRARVVQIGPFAETEGTHGHIRVEGTLANAGDATAFRLTLSSSSGRSGLTTRINSPTSAYQQHDWLAVVRPGESVDYWAEVPPGDWSDLVITLDWIATPTRLKKHLQFELKPSEFRPDPTSIDE